MALVASQAFFCCDVKGFVTWQFPIARPMSTEKNNHRVCIYVYINIYIYILTYKQTIKSKKNIIYIYTLYSIHYIISHHLYCFLNSCGLLKKWANCKSHIAYKWVVFIHLYDQKQPPKQHTWFFHCFKWVHLLELNTCNSLDSFQFSSNQCLLLLYGKHPLTSARF